MLEPRIPQGKAFALLQLSHISKTYTSGDIAQHALNDVSLCLRDSEFVAILGPSGSGKTTLLNIVGGLDRYDEGAGDLIINGVSTKRYSDRDWDSYRNHSIGFVFQSYNLISHQSVLANVELSLTISGVGKRERRERAKAALESVGLGDQLRKLPSQLSGGQMQRVAIARALVNDPSILLADEPTGALDTETSIQVMDLLKRVASDRLVVMVTHNPELAQRYATRIIRLQDGRIIDDSNPFEIVAPAVPEETADSDEREASSADESVSGMPASDQPADQPAPDKHATGNRTFRKRAARNRTDRKRASSEKASMSFGTSFALSFSNLRTKKSRTLLTAFAGSIGIIGIALILSLSSGVRSYILDMQQSTMESYPITIERQGVDLNSMLEEELGSDASEGDSSESEANGHGRDGIYANVSSYQSAQSYSGVSVSENNLSAFKRFLEDPDSGVQQYVGRDGIVYSYDTRFDVFARDADGTLINTDGSTRTGEGESVDAANSTELLSSAALASSSLGGNDTFGQIMPGAGDAPVSEAVIDNYDVVYGSWPSSYDEVVLVLDDNNEISIDTLFDLGILSEADYEEALGQIISGEQVTLEQTGFSYEKACEGTLLLVPACDRFVEGDDGVFSYVDDEDLEEQGLLDGAVRLKISGVVRPKDDADFKPLSHTVCYTKQLTDYLIEHADQSAVVQAQRSNPDVNVLTGEAFGADEDSSTSLSALSMLAMLGSDHTSATYEDNMEMFGAVDPDNPSMIEIYVDTFEDKDGLQSCIDAYNASVPEEDRITYTDYIGLITGSVTSIINSVSSVLIAFVAISLVVSSIMIGIITYISVLERTKEIGILRALGASKRNIAQVFNAETFIIGLLAGVMGIVLSEILLIPINRIIPVVTETDGIVAFLPPFSALVLVALSVLLTLISGIIPARKASKRDPVVALRSGE